MPGIEVQIMDLPVEVPRNIQLRFDERPVNQQLLHFAYYNFVGIHGSLRVTPAMAAGVTERTWSLEDLISTL